MGTEAVERISTCLGVAITGGQGGGRVGRGGLLQKECRDPGAWKGSPVPPGIPIPSIRSTAHTKKQNQSAVETEE